MMEVERGAAEGPWEGGPKRITRVQVEGAVQRG